VLAGLSLAMVALLAVAGVLLDLLLGEARRWHPLVGFGNLANWLERRLNRGRMKRCRGALAWSLAVLPLTAAAYGLLLLLAYKAPVAALAVHVLLLYFAIGLRSLRDHTAPIAVALAAGDLAAARSATARIVSRDTAQAGPSELAKAGVESLLENGNDAVFGALFWFVIAGGPGALLFRLANTLDAMWGYRTARLNEYGCVAARIDDGLNLAPARLTALTYALIGNTGAALRCWRTQAPLWSSPNAGPVMAAGAGALGVVLGGSAIYEGVVESRPLLGAGRPARGTDIGRAWRLVAATTACWLTSLIVIAAVIALIAVIAAIAAIE
jgi:adenosylcobinamide-phosphate synthase